jgi:short-subunit dehydrogenase
VNVEVMAEDLSKRRALDRVAERLASPERPVGLLVNNAGFGTSVGFLEAPVAVSERSMDVMMRAVMVLSHAAAGQMTARGRGAILNVASVAGHMASGTYAAAKAWVTRFTEALSVELSGTGVTATAVLPGLTHTEFHARAGLNYGDLPEWMWLSPQQVVSRALADVRRGAVLSTPSVRYGLLGQAARVAPRWVVRSLSGNRR